MEINLSDADVSSGVALMSHFCRCFCFWDLMFNGFKFNESECLTKKNLRHEGYYDERFYCLFKFCPQQFSSAN